MSRFSFAIVSDVHVKSNGQVHDAFRQVVELLVPLGPRFVVANGDATVGNPDDGVSDAKVKSWWQGFTGALAPLFAAGIPVLPIAGNHDYYTAAHRRGYETCWQNLREQTSSLAPLSGQPPLSYSFMIDNVYFLFLHVIDQELGPTVENFLIEELASEPAKSAALRLSFGHVPLLSMMGKSNQSFCAKLGGLLSRGGVAAYFSGHEHLFWDQLLAFSEGQLRQVHVGTSSGAYHFPLSPSTYATHCKGDTGTIPYTGQLFQLIPGTRRQKDEVTLVLVNINLEDPVSLYEVIPLSLRDGALVRFGG